MPHSGTLPIGRVHWCRSGNALSSGPVGNWCADPSSRSASNIAWLPAASPPSGMTLWKVNFPLDFTWNFLCRIGIRQRRL